MKKISITIISLMLFMALANGITAYAAGVTEVVRTTIDRAMKILNDPSLKGPEKESEKRELLRTTIREVIDFEEMSRRSLARHWRKRTEAEKKEFVALFSNLLENSYMDKIEANRDARIFYDGEKRAGNKVEVRTRVVTKKGLVVPIRYRLMNKKGKWVVYDILIEGVSLVSSYRTQFDRIIRTSSYKELINRLKKKVREAAR